VLLLLLFIVFSRSDCDHSKGKGFLAAIYFVVFVIIASMVLLTLFVGVVSTSMDEAGAKAKKQVCVCVEEEVGGA
jgi:hypothetical protein